MSQAARNHFRLLWRFRGEDVTGIDDPEVDADESVTLRGSSFRLVRPQSLCILRQWLATTETKWVEQTGNRLVWVWIRVEEVERYWYGRGTEEGLINSESDFCYVVNKGLAVHANIEYNKMKWNKIEYDWCRKRFLFFPVDNITHKRFQGGYIIPVRTLSIHASSNQPV